LVVCSNVWPVSIAYIITSTLIFSILKRRKASHTKHTTFALTLHWSDCRQQSRD